MSSEDERYVMIRAGASGLAGKPIFYGRTEQLTQNLENAMVYGSLDVALEDAGGRGLHGPVSTGVSDPVVSIKEAEVLMMECELFSAPEKRDYIKTWIARRNLRG